MSHRRMPRPVRSILSILATVSALSALSALVSGCLGGGNSGSETTNGLAGLVRDGQKRPVIGARVVLLEEDHNGAMPEGSKRPPETRTDGHGAYRFQDLRPGTYNLEFTDTVSGYRCRVPGVRIEMEAMATVGGVVAPTGSIEIPVPDFLGNGKSGYLYIPGASDFARVDSAARIRGTVILESVAPGDYPSLNLVVDGNTKNPLVLAENLEVTSGARTKPSPFQTWTYARKIEVGPFSSGIGISGLVTDFPLLVRLSSANFDFSQAAPDGRDLRFTDPGGKVLDFEIERWSGTESLAAIWVRLDSLRWDAPGQEITMHWGRPDAVPVSSGARVFPAPAYATVLHLSEPDTNQPDSYRDATDYGNHATADSANGTDRVEGVAGYAKAFAGDLGSLTAAVPPGLSGDASFTITLWMKAGLEKGRSNILDFGLQRKFAGVHLLLRADSIAQFGAFDSAGSGETAPWQNVFEAGDYLGKWTHVAMVYDSSAKNMSTWMNGIKVSESVLPEPLQVDAAAGLRIGKALMGSAQEKPYSGLMDEVRFHASVLPAARLRLEYETEKP
ncbi:MAG: DUF2341 domain-containing protein [Fibrobacteres bacterium]|nr:DUF2341 domain-containing protein [Fibrobacterota bacterium]